MRLSDLPLVIHQELLSFLGLEDQFDYSKITRNVYQSLVKDTRKISLEQDEANKFFNDHNFQEYVLGLVRNPSKQLSITLPDHGIGVIEATQTFSFYVLQASPEDFSHYLAPIVSQVYRLELTPSLPYERDSGSEGSDEEDDEEAEEAKALLYDAIMTQASQKGVVELCLNGIKVNNFPLIPSLELLNFSDSFQSTIPLHHFPNLRVVKFERCVELVDVSSLGHIYDLSLIFCDRITDISFLNYNTKINIRNCFCIEDYSNSFKFSKNISVRYFDNSDIKPINLEILQHVQSLSIYGPKNRMRNVIPFTHSFTLPSSLKTLRIEEIHIPFTLPDSLESLKHLSLSFITVPVIVPRNHRLTSISLSNCPNIDIPQMNSIKIAQFVYKTPNKVRATEARDFEIDPSLALKQLTKVCANDLRSFHVILEDMTDVPDFSRVTHLNLSRYTMYTLDEELLNEIVNAKCLTKLEINTLGFFASEERPNLIKALKACVHLEEIIVCLTSKDLKRIDLLFDHLSLLEDHYTISDAVKNFRLRLTRK